LPKRQRPSCLGGPLKQIPAMTYSRPRRTTIGPGCLTAVFGMGTGGTIQVCSPRKFLTAGINPAAQTAGINPAAHLGGVYPRRRVDPGGLACMPKAAVGVVSVGASKGPRRGSKRPSVRLLVPVSCVCCHTYTSGLSTWSSSRSLRPLKGQET
jgi:hypothetical protein